MLGIQHEVRLGWNHDGWDAEHDAAPGASPLRSEHDRRLRRRHVPAANRAGIDDLDDALVEFRSNGDQIRRCVAEIGERAEIFESGERKGRGRVGGANAPGIPALPVFRGPVPIVRS